MLKDPLGAIRAMFSLLWRAASWRLIWWSGSVSPIQQARQPASQPASQPTSWVMIFFSFCGARKQHRYSLFSLSNLHFWPEELGGTFAMWQAFNARILVPAPQPRATSNFQRLLLECFAGMISCLDFAPRRARNTFEFDVGITFQTRLQIEKK